jgi:nitrite reductase (NADH) large subunit
MSTHGKERHAVLVVGAGMAAHRFCATLTGLAPARFQVTAIGEEAAAPYNRVGLSALLAGEVEAPDLALGPAGEEVEWVSGMRVTGIDRAGRQVSLSDGSRRRWDTLVLACGSTPVLPPLAGQDASGVHRFRTLDDVRAILHDMTPNGAAVVIGGGLLGLEAAHGLSRRGASVTVIHLADRLLERQLDDPGGRRLRRRLAMRGIDCRLGTRTAAIETSPEGRVRAVVLADGERIGAQVVVIATGVRPNIDLAREAGLACGRGILVDDHLRTSDERVFAIGECSEHRGRCYGLVAPVWEQAEVCARVIAGEPGGYHGSSDSTHLKISGVAVYSAGRVEATAEDEEIRLEDGGGDAYRRLLIRGEHLVGAILYGDASDAAWYTDLIRRRESIGSLRPHLAFGQAFTGSGLAWQAERAGSPGGAGVRHAEVAGHD